MRCAAALVVAACGSNATAPVSGRGGTEAAKAVELGHDGLRGLEYGEPVTAEAIDALLPGAKLRREDREGGATVWTVVERASAKVTADAMTIHDNLPFGVQRQVEIRSPRMRTALGVAPGDRLGELAKRQRVTCSIQGQRWLDCRVPGTRFSLRTEGSGLTEKEMIDNVVEVHDHPDHAIQYITWHGPVRTRELRAQPLDHATLTRGGLGPVVRMPAAELRRHLPAGVTAREQPSGNEIVVERNGRVLVRFVVGAGELSEAVVDTPGLATAHGIRVGDAYGTAFTAQPRVTCWVEADAKQWRARCDDGDVELVLEPHPLPAPGGGGGHATVPPLQVATDKVVELRAMLH